MALLVVISSKNPVKINAVKLAFEKAYPQQNFNFEGVDVPSGVADQPVSDTETLDGAQNRVRNASELCSKADFWVGIEGGIETMYGEMQAFAWVFIKSKQTIGKAKTATFFLPQEISKLIEEGKELGEADDILFGKTNSKQNNGAVGILTQGLIDRTKLYKEAVILALIPFKNGNLNFR